jgi:hypothetical protein
MYFYIGNGGTHAYLKLALYNPLDESQQWVLVSAGSVGPGNFVVSRAYPSLNFDVSGMSPSFPLSPFINHTYLFFIQGQPYQRVLE